VFQTREKKLQKLQIPIPRYTAVRMQVWEKRRQ